MSKENRKQPRRHLIYYLQVVHSETGRPLGRLVDITPIGMMLISKQALEPGLEIPVRMMLPSRVGQDVPLDLMGQIVWCHKDVNPDYYAAGFRFQSPPPECVLMIQDLIDTLGFRDGVE